MKASCLANKVANFVVATMSYMMSCLLLRENHIAFGLLLLGAFAALGWEVVKPCGEN
jgi:hypothetical protein